MQKRKHANSGFTVLELLIAFGLIAIISVSAFYFGTLQKSQNKQASSQTSQPTPTQSTTLANPASVHCKQVGGTLEIRKDAAGNEYGICDVRGFKCEEWALLRGECKPTSKFMNAKDATGAASPGTTTQLANPASANCIKLGGTLSIQTRGDGGQYGVCEFGSGYACEEWALFRGDCPKTGIKTTGFDTPAQSYCALIGGRTLAVPDATCTFKDGSVCSDEALFNGLCHKGEF